MLSSAWRWVRIHDFRQGLSDQLFAETAAYSEGYRGLRYEYRDVITDDVLAEKVQPKKREDSFGVGEGRRKLEIGRSLVTQS